MNLSLSKHANLPSQTPKSCLKDTHREKAPCNNTPALTKSMNIDMWVVGTSNQVFIRGSTTETKFPK